MITPKVNWEINISTIMHLVVLIGGLLITYGQFTTKFDSATASLKEMEYRTIRLEHYISSQDPDYWRKVTQNGDNR